MSRKVVSLALALGLILAGCDFSAPRQALGSLGTFVGRVAGSEVFIGFVVEGSSVMAYVCDGKALGEWFVGEVVGGTAELVSQSGAKIAATVGDAARGSLTLAGEAAPKEFAAEVARGSAGVFRGEGVAAGLGFVGGLIMLNDGQFRGLASSAGYVEPIAGPVVVGDDGIVKLDSVGRFGRVELKRATPSMVKPPGS